ncbi:MAG: hypothetical protein PF482_03550 [Desulfobacteraceae bacterium]|jgi:hypothetical protein|nr:hypothetical protein [Desulfobacteraceae bacterium]
MKPRILCKHCHRKVPANPRLKNQDYCNRKRCQRARKTEWERHKIATDQDYCTNRKESRTNWQEKNPGYWAEYRRTHPKYRRKNRQKQKLRDAKRKARRLAKMDTLKRGNYVMPGGYYLIPIMDDLAKMDASMQKIIIIPDGYEDIGTSCKKGLDGHKKDDWITWNSKEECHDAAPIISGPGP